MRVKVAVAPEMGRKVFIEEVNLAEPGLNEVRIKVMACTICHSDIHAIAGEHGEYEGSAAVGHEVAGIIDAIGEGVTYVKPGDRVLCSLMSQGCGYCDRCLAGHSMWFCRNLNLNRDTRISPLSRDNGDLIRQPYGFAGYATYTNAADNRIVKLDDDIPFEVAAILACGFVSGGAAVFNRCQLIPGQSFAVTGCGGVGMSAVMAAHVSGAAPLIAIDPNPIKREKALKFGAAHVIDPTAVDVVQAVLDITDGFGVNHSLVAVAEKTVKRSTFSFTAGDGQMVVVGHGHPKDEDLSEFSIMEFLRGKRIIGSILGNINLRRDIPKYMDMYRLGLLDIEAMIDARYDLDNIQQALDDSENPDMGLLKVVVVCNDYN